MGRGTLVRHAVTGTAAGVVAAPGIYLLALTALSRSRHACATDQSVRFAVVIPAHDEEPGIADTVRSVLSLDYPTDGRRVVVVADNCTDATAEVARREGAEVLERHDDDLRGKGHALRFAFDHLLADPWVDAVVVIDADTLVSPDLLRRATGHLAPGDQAVQFDYRVRNPGDSWRTQLVDVAFTCNHQVRSSGRSRIGASAGLRGNGMVFTRSTLERVPASAFSVVEDLEYGLALGDAGIRVGFCDAAWVAGDMPTSASAATSQRARWEAGRSSIRRTATPRLVRRALRTRSVLDGDLAADLLVPPLASVATMLVAGTAVAAVGRRRLGSTPLPPLLLGLAGLVLHVVTGIHRSQGGWRRALPAMARVPGYIVWKVGVRAGSASRRDGQPLTWTRTERSGTHGV